MPLPMHSDSPKPSSNPCPRPHRFWTNGTYSGRTGSGPLARRVSLECECGANECLISARKCGFERFQCRCTLLVHSPKPSSNSSRCPHRLWMNGTDSGRTGILADERAEGPLARRVSVECECATPRTAISNSNFHSVCPHPCRSWPLARRVSAFAARTAISNLNSNFHTVCRCQKRYAPTRMLRFSAKMPQKAGFTPWH